MQAYAGLILVFTCLVPVFVGLRAFCYRFVMAKRCIGIDFDSSGLCAVQMARNGDRFRMEKVFSCPMRRESDSPVQLLQSLLGRGGFDKRGAVAVSTSHNDIFFRTIQTGNSTDKTTETQKNTAVRNDFPIPAEQIITANCLPGSGLRSKKTTLEIAVSRKSLNRRIDTVRQAQMRCEHVDGPVFAVYAAVAVNHPEIACGTAIVVYSDHSHIIIAVTENNDILAVRNIPNSGGAETDNGPDPDEIASLLLRETELTWRAAFGEKIPENTNLVLAGQISQDAEVISALRQALACRATVMNLSANIDCSDVSEMSYKYVIAQGLALRVLAPKDTIGINLIKAAREKTDKNIDIKKHVVVSLVLVAALAGVWLTGLFVRKSRLEKDYENITQQGRLVFQQTVPSEQTIVNELAQLDSHLQTLRRDYEYLEPLVGTGVNPVAVLHAISVNTPRELKVRIENLSITGPMVGISAVCDDFETANRWRNILRKVPQFVSVEVVSEPARQPDSDSISFEISIRTER
jgi:hypothetical protein